MLWRVRALLEDRPGAMAELAARCGRENVNILGLQVFPTADGRVVDELVLHTPGGWRLGDVERLCAQAGVSTASVVACTARALEDQPVRYLRAAQVVVDEPDRLQEQLCRLLDAKPDETGRAPDALVLDDDEGPPVRLVPQQALTATELSRAVELRRLAVTGGARPATEQDAMVGQRQDPPAPDAPVLMRPGTPEDVEEVRSMHARCSAETLRRRYHQDPGTLDTATVLGMLSPPGGLGVVLEADGQVVGLGLVAGTDGTVDEPELGILVEDRWQRQGHGTRLMRALAVEAANRGAEAVLCVVEPDNEAVLRTIRRSGLRALVSYVDGSTEYRVLVGRLAGRARIPGGPGRRRSNRPAMGEVTAPLTNLLHQRRELREVYPPADLIDQAVRGGA